MPDGIESDQFLDVVASTRNLVLKLDGESAKGFSYLFASNAPNKFEILGPVLQDRKQMRQGGSAMDWYVVYRDYGSFQWVNPAQTYQPGIVNVLAKGTAPWRHGHWDYSFVRDEVKTCRGEEQLCDMFRARRAAAQVSAALEMEQAFWDSPSTSSLAPLGMSYFVSPIFGGQVTDTGNYGSNVNGAFQGGLPNNDSTTWSSGVAGIDPGGLYTQGSGFASSTYARHRNWNFAWSNSAGAYTDVDEDNLGNMIDALSWELPAIVSEINKPPYNMLKIYLDQTVKNSMERAAKNQNDQVGPDLARYQNATTFRGIPLTRIKALDTQDQNYRGIHPVYCCNWAHGHLVFREGEYFMEQIFGPDRYMQDVTTISTDVTYQFAVTDRQKFCGVGSYVAAG